MQISLEIISVGAPQTVPTKNGKSYQCVEVAYKKDGKIEGKKIVSFTNPGVFQAVQELSQGEIVSVTTEKGQPNAQGQSYWQWEAIGAVSPAQTQAATAAAPSGGGYAKTQEVQVMIVRQSSLGHAVALLAVQGDKKVSYASVVDIARHFEAYVLGKEPPSAMKDIADMQDDVPL